MNESINESIYETVACKLMSGVDLMTGGSTPLDQAANRQTYWRNIYVKRNACGNQPMVQCNNIAVVPGCEQRRVMLMSANCHARQLGITCTIGCRSGCNPAGNGRCSDLLGSAPGKPHVGHVYNISYSSCLCRERI